MRILYFAPKECWPPTTGALVRNYYLARELARHASVSYLSFSDDTNVVMNGGKPGSNPAVASELAQVAMDWCENAVTVRRGSGYTLAKLARGAVGRLPVTVLNYLTTEMAQALERTLEQGNFDVVQVESIHLAPYLPIIRSARSRPLAVCDWHNIESALMRQYSDRAANPLRRLYARRTAHQLHALELQAAEEFDAHLTVTEPDRLRLAEFAPSARAFVIANGVDCDYYSDSQIDQAYASWEGKSEVSPSRALSGNGHLQTNIDQQAVSDTRRRRLLFVGSMDYHANVDGVLQFTRSVWPRIHAQRPDIAFTIVGRNPPPEIRELQRVPGVEVTGMVEDVRPYYREAMAAVVPLRVGGGSRLKIMEAMAAGVPVISTRLGAEGIEVTDGENILFAETDDEFCQVVGEIDQDQERWRRLTDAGRLLVRENYDWAGLGAALAEVYRELLANGDKSIHESIKEPVDAYA